MTEIAAATQTAGDARALVETVLSAERGAHVTGDRAAALGCWTDCGLTVRVERTGSMESRHVEPVTVKVSERADLSQSLPVGSLCEGLLRLHGDVLGRRRWYLASIPGGVVAADTVNGVLSALPNRPAINERWLREALAGRHDRRAAETCFQGIEALTPGSSLEISADARVRHGGDRLLGGDSREATTPTALQSALRAAVRSSMSGYRPEEIGVLVSGGLDSSSVAALVNEALQESGVGKARAYHCWFAETPAADELDYADQLLRALPRLDGVKIQADDCWSLKEFGTEGGYTLDEPEIEVTRALLVKPLLQAAADGCKLVLTGYWGDQVMGTDPYCVPHLLDDLGPAGVWGELTHFRGHTGLSAGRLLAGTAYRRLGGTRRGAGASAEIPWLVPAEAAESRPVPLERENQSRAVTRIIAELQSGLSLARHSMLRHIAHRCGVRLGFPFLDLRVIAASLGVPSRERFRDGFGKFILRRAMEPLLPDRVVWRRGTAHFTELVDRGLRDRERAKAEQLVQNSLAAQAGWVDLPKLQAGWQAYLGGDDRLRNALIAFLCAEAWLRHWHR